LYFAVSTDVGPTLGGIEMSNFNYPVTRSVYVAILDKKLPSPLAPESDEEKGVDAAEKNEPAGKDGDEKGKEKAKKKAAPTVRIDLEDLDQRILALPIPARGYVGLRTGKAGVVFLLENPLAPVGAGGFGGPKLILHKFDLDKRKAEKFMEGVGRLAFS